MDMAVRSRGRIGCLGLSMTLGEGKGHADKDIADGEHCAGV